MDLETTAEVNEFKKILEYDMVLEILTTYIVQLKSIASSLHPLYHKPYSMVRLDDR